MYFFSTNLRHFFLIQYKCLSMMYRLSKQFPSFTGQRLQSEDSMVLVAEFRANFLWGTFGRPVNRWESYSLDTGAEVHGLMWLLCVNFDAISVQSKCETAVFCAQWGRWESVSSLLQLIAPNVKVLTGIINPQGWMVDVEPLCIQYWFISHG